MNGLTLPLKPASRARRCTLDVSLISVLRGALSYAPLGDPARKYKGRVVFQGNQIKDESWEVASRSLELSGDDGGWEGLRLVRFS